MNLVRMLANIKEQSYALIPLHLFASDKAEVSLAV